MNATTIATQTRRAREWFAAWFDSAHSHKLYAHRSDAEAARFVDTLVERQILRPGAAVLDLGCGAGRHSRYLASRGFDVTGLDLWEESLRKARRGESATLRFVRQDMRAPFGVSRFDHVVNLFTSFGNFDDIEDHLAVVVRCGVVAETDRGRPPRRRFTGATGSSGCGSPSRASSRGTTRASSAARGARSTDRSRGT